MRSARREGPGQEGPGNRAGDVVFTAAVAGLRAGRDAQRPLRPQVSFEDVPAPRRLAPYAAAVAATVRAPEPGAEGPDLAWGRLVLLYDPDGQPGWAGPFRVVAYIRADVESEMAADPLLGAVSWSWLTEALDARAAGYAAPSGTVTRVITEGFGGKRDEPPATGLELRASWSPVPAGVQAAGVQAGRQAAGRQAAERQAAGVQAAGVPELAGHVAAWCDTLCAAAGLPPVPAGTPAGAAPVRVMPRRGRRP